MVGKPVIEGTRIPVALILGKLAYNLDLDELFLDYPRLSVDDIKAVLLYAQSLVAKVPKAKRPRRYPGKHEVAAWRRSHARLTDQPATLFASPSTPARPSGLL